MMRKLLRSALVALLVGMVPIQALAALSVDVCSTMEHSNGYVQHGGTDHGDGSFGSPMNDEQGATDDTHHHLASCGVAAAIVSAATVLTADAPGDGVQASPIRAPEGFLPERLDRPPLTLSI